jgi:hypothetical protein
MKRPNNWLAPSRRHSGLIEITGYGLRSDGNGTPEHLNRWRNADSPRGDLPVPFAQTALPCTNEPGADINVRNLASLGGGRVSRRSDSPAMVVANTTRYRVKAVANTTR